MPTALIITTAFPPFAMAGSERMAAFARHLNQDGWEAIVVAPHAPRARTNTAVAEPLPKLPIFRYQDVLHSRTPLQKLYRMMTAKARMGLITYGGLPRPNLAHGMMAVNAALQHHDADVILASFVRPLALRLGAYAHRRTGAPWVAEFRDSAEFIVGGWAGQMMQRREVDVVKTAKHLIATSDIVADHLRSRHSQPVTIIPSGYARVHDLDDPPASDGPFTIVHTGRLYHTRNPRVIFAAVDKLIDEQVIGPDEIRIRFYDAANPTLRVGGLERFRQVLRHPEIVEYLPAVPHKQAIRIQRDADLLLLLPGLITDIGGNVPAKLYEYLAARRPVLSLDTHPQPVIEEQLTRFAAGLATSDLASTTDFLRDQIARWREHGSTRLPGWPDELDTLSLDARARAMRELLADVAGRPR